MRPAYLFEKAMMLAGAMSLLFLTVSHYIYPVLDNLPTMSLIESVLTLVFPFLLAYLLIFYIIFECICNFMAEATRFADREFYEDWWNRYRLGRRQRRGGGTVKRLVGRMCVPSTEFR